MPKDLNLFPPDAILEISTDNHGLIGTSRASDLPVRQAVAVEPLWSGQSVLPVDAREEKLLAFSVPDELFSKCLDSKQVHLAGPGRDGVVTYSFSLLSRLNDEEAARLHVRTGNWIRARALERFAI